MIAIIPAAGRGTRLGPLTEEIPKPLIPVAGRPVISRVIEGALGAGIGTFVVVLGYLGDQVMSKLRAEYPEADIRFVRQTEQNGTAGAFLACREEAGDGPFLYAWADVVVPAEAYSTVVAAHERGVSVLGVDRTNDPTQGAAVLVRGGFVADIVEKPPPGTFAPAFNATGLGVLAPEAWRHLGLVRPSPRGELELTSALQSMVNDDCPVRAVEVGPAFDIGTSEGLAAARRWLHESE